MAVQVQNLRALLLRDLMLRYGRDNLGFVWMVLEPILLTGGVLLIWPLLGASKNGVRVVELVLTGYMPLTLWRHLSNHGVGLLRASVGLLFHRRVSLNDIVLCRMLLEFLGVSIALVVVWSVLSVFEIIGEVKNYPALLGGWLMMGWIGLACGALLAALTEYSHTAERFVQPFQYLIIPISGAFFLVDWLPEWGRKFVLLNPLVHCYEVFRFGYFGEAVPTHFDVAYFSAVCFALSFMAVVALKAARVRMQDA